MVDVTFLEPSGTRRMAKTFSQNAVSSYPMVKTMTSNHFSHDATAAGLVQRLQIIEEQALRGAVLLKGHLTRPIKDESRAGLADKDRLTDTLVLDIDGLVINGYTVPDRITKVDMATLSSDIISWLPDDFAQVSYICHASSSMGMKGNKVSMHLEFLLSEPISPQYQKTVLEHLNLTVPELRDSITLTPSGGALSPPLDVTMAQNSRLIYIAPPLFIAPAVDPIDADARVILIQKTNHALNVSALADHTSLEKHRVTFNKLIKDKRKLLGLPSKTEKTQRVNLDGVMLEVVTNPDQVMMEVVSDDGDFLRYNINHGDSAAYYVRKASPTIVYNFKGEKPFLLEPSNPELFQELMITTNSSTDPSMVSVKRPFAFRDVLSDTFHAGFRVGPNLESLQSIGPSNIKDFFSFHGAVKPEVVPQLYYHFSPNDPRQFDLSNQFVNKYHMPEIISDPVPIPEQYQAAVMGEGALLSELCPTIYTIMHHICGSDIQTFEFFLNWFVSAVQTKDKLGTTWVFHGVQGTGKGLFFENIIRPIFGAKYCAAKRLEDLGEKYNGFIGDHLFVMVDEFRMTDVGAGKESKLENTIKQLITEKHMTGREMYKDQKTMESFLNYIFCSNNEDSIRIAEGDRRWNVAPKQTVALKDAFPAMMEGIIAKIKAEIPMFAAYVMSYKPNVSVAMVAVESKAKAEMRVMSKKTHERFADALRKGELDFFLDYYFEQAMSDVEYASKVMYDTTMKRMLMQSGKPMILSNHEIRVMYQRVMSKPISTVALSRLLRLEGITIKLFKRNKKVSRGFENTYTASVYDLEKLITEEIDPAEVEKYGLDSVKSLH